MNSATASLAVVLTEAHALWQELNGTSLPTKGIAERAARLAIAAKTCHRALSAEPCPPAPVVDRFEGWPAETQTATPLLEPDHVQAIQRRVDPRALSSREFEVLRLIAAGYRDRQIAEALLVSPRTVTT